MSIISNLPSQHLFAMKKYTLLPVIAIFLLSLVSGCDQDPEPVTVEKRAYVRFFNSFGDAAVNLRFRTYGETRFLTDRLMPRTSWPQGGYTSLLTRYTGEGPIEGLDSVYFDVEHYDADTLMIKDYRESLPEGSYSTLYVVDSVGKLIMAITRDQFDRPTGNSSAYRFINLYPFYNSVGLESSNAADSLDFSFNSLEFLGHSGFREVPSGRRTLSAIRTQGQITVDSVSQVKLDAGGVYVFVLMDVNGIPVLDYERIN